MSRALLVHCRDYGRTEIIEEPRSQVGSLAPIDLRRDGAAAEVARNLLEYLKQGHVQAGGRLPSERALADALKVGRSIVREALKTLTLLGVLEVRPGDGTFLQSSPSNLLPQTIEWGLLLSVKQTRDLVEARRYLEVIVAGLAAERRDEGALAQMRESLRRMHEVEGDAEAYVAADMAYHLGVSQAARNEALLNIMMSVRSLLRVWILRVVTSAGFQASAAQHDPIYQAIEGGDATAARKAMDSHMVWAVDSLDASLRDEPRRSGRPKRAPTPPAHAARPRRSSSTRGS
jgi:GntR family transcriptional regulator, transcriptional repressor for pyruvate dehydrogenase complex